MWWSKRRSWPEKKKKKKFDLGRVNRGDQRNQIIRLSINEGCWFIRRVLIRSDKWSPTPVPSAPKVHVQTKIIAALPLIKADLRSPLACYNCSLNSAI